MTPYKNLILLFGLTILGFLVVILGVDRITFSHARFSRGEQLERLSKQALTLVRRGDIPVADLRNPFNSIVPFRKDFPPIPLAEATDGLRPSDENRVSMILLRDRQKLAVIDNHVAREGDSVNQDKVLRIEKDRVLLKTTHARERWVTLAPEKDQSARRADSVQSSPPSTGREEKEIKGTSTQTRTQDEARKSMQ